MNSVASPKVLEALEIIAKYVSASPTEAPAEFVRDLAQRWKERGGTVAGKPRHSDRYLDDLLRWQNTPIRSLTPKLVGRTNLKAADADVLVRLFLSHWDYIGDPNSGENGARSADLYKPLLSDAEIEGVCGYVADRISTVGAEARGEAKSGVARPMPGQDTIDLIATEFQEAAAYFTIGAGQTMLVAQPETALIGFRNLMNRLWAIDKADGQKRALIWTLDLGRQDFDDPESRLRFMNVESLISRFKALKRFKESVTEARWNWLQSRSIIALHDTHNVRPDVFRLPAFDAHHVLFSAIPVRWAGLPEFLTLYGDKLERINQANYTIFLRRSNEQSLKSSTLSDDMERHFELRYFGHALLKSGEGGRQPRGLQLNSPGRSYAEALGTLYTAATHLLNSTGSVKLPATEGEEALNKLKSLDFELLRLDAFVKLEAGTKLESISVRSIISPVQDAVQNWDFFLSYSEEDEPFARWIKRLLEATGLSVFSQFSDMPTGSNFVREMQRGLARSSRFIALLSPGYVKSDHCQAEWSAAYNTDPGGGARKLLPFLVRPTELPPLARQIVYKPLVGLSPLDAANAVLQVIGHEGKVGNVPHGWPAGAAVEQMRAATGGVYEVAPGADLLLGRQPSKTILGNSAGFTPEQLFSDFLREVDELASHVKRDSGNVRCSDRLKERVARLHQTIIVGFSHCDVLATNRHLVWVLRTLADDKADGVIAANDELQYYASDLYGYYNRLEFIFPNLKPYREMDARHRFMLPSTNEEEAIHEVYRIFGDPTFARAALSPSLSEEMKQAGESIEEAKKDAEKRPTSQISELTIESHADAATRSLAIWSWVSNARENFVKSGKNVEELERAIKNYEKLYDTMLPKMATYLGYLLKWFF